MALHGRPSRACQTCRARKKKCDQRRPSCSQCTRSEIQCLGYRRRRHDEAAKPKPPALGITKALQIPTQQLEQCYFIHNFASRAREANKAGVLDFIAPLAEQRSPHPPLHFVQAFEACAAASFSSRDACGSMQNALQKYTAALATTSHALRGRATCSDDATVASVLLLGLCEQIMATDVGSMASSAHIHGLVHLIRLGGGERLETRIGWDIFRTVYGQVVIHSLITGEKPIAGDFDQLLLGKSYSDRDATARHSAWHDQLVTQTAFLQAEANSILAEPMNAENVTQAREILQKCQLVNQQLLDWSNWAPDSFAYKTAAWQARASAPSSQNWEAADVFPGHIDIYPDLWTASTWNMTRCSRIILASVAVRCSARVHWPADFRTLPAYASAAKVWSRSFEDIFASVPYLTGWFASRRGIFETDELQRFGHGVPDTGKAIAGYLLVWPLVCIRDHPYLTADQRTWIRGRLEVLVNRFGIGFATILRVATRWMAV